MQTHYFTELISDELNFRSGTPRQRQSVKWCGSGTGSFPYTPKVSQSYIFGALYRMKCQQPYIQASLNSPTHSSVRNVTTGPIQSIWGRPRSQLPCTLRPQFIILIIRVQDNRVSHLCTNPRSTTMCHSNRPSNSGSRKFKYVNQGVVHLLLQGAQPRISCTQTPAWHFGLLNEELTQKCLIDLLASELIGNLA